MSWYLVIYFLIELYFISISQLAKITEIIVIWYGLHLKSHEYLWNTLFLYKIVKKKRNKNQLKKIHWIQCILCKKKRTL